MRKIEPIDVLKSKVNDAADFINENNTGGIYNINPNNLFEYDFNSYFMEDPWMAIEWASFIDKLLTIAKYCKRQAEYEEALGYTE